MGWASSYIQQLIAGETIDIRPRGNSMVPKINSGDLCNIRPFVSATDTLRKGDVVLCTVRGNQYLHNVSATKGEQVQISNNKGLVNGWTSLSHIYGVLVKVTP